jgi:hypothetical protein
MLRSTTNLWIRVEEARVDALEWPTSAHEAMQLFSDAFVDYFHCLVECSEDEDFLLDALLQAYNAAPRRRGWHHWHSSASWCGRNVIGTRTKGDHPGMPCLCGNSLSAREITCNSRYIIDRWNYLMKIYASSLFIVNLWSMGRFPTLNLFVFHTRVNNLLHSSICLQTSSNLPDANTW